MKCTQALKAADEELELNARLDNLREELLSGRRIDSHEKAYSQFFDVRETPKRGISVKIKLLTSSEESLNSKLFVEFVALIYLAYINRKMQEKGLYKDYTMEKLLLELESIQSICEPGRSPLVCEVLEKQRKIFEALEVMPPQ